MPLCLRVQSSRSRANAQTQFSRMEQRENLLDIIKVLFQWKKPIIYLCLGVGLLSALLSLLLPNYYQSTSIFYAASMDQAKPGQIFGTSTTDTDFYGNDHDNDRLLTIAESNDVADYLIQKFDLYTHYDIDTTNEKAPFKVKEKFFKYYKVMKTKRDAIELSMEDTDKEQAANIVNEARAKIDELYIKVVRDQLEKLQQSLQKNIEEKENNIAQINDTLIHYRNTYGVYSTEAQGEKFAEQILSTESKLARESARLATLEKNPTISRDTIALMKAMAQGYKNELKSLQEKMQLFNKGVSKVTVLEREEKELGNRLGFQKVQLSQLETTVNSPISGINLIEAGTVPVMKSRPKRSIIVVSAILISLIFSVIGILLFDAYKDVDWGEVLR